MNVAHMVPETSAKPNESQPGASQHASQAGASQPGASQPGATAPATKAGGAPHTFAAALHSAHASGAKREKNEPAPVPVPVAIPAWIAPRRLRNCR